MKFVSTRGNSPAVSISEAIRRGAAPDGGLYVPESLPKVDFGKLSADMPLAEFAVALLAPFFAGDPLEAHLPAIAAEAFDFPVPLTTPAYVNESLRLKASVPLSVTSPTMLPFVPPSPSCKAPALIVVPPV